jgi:hypothetical protein
VNFVENVADWSFLSEPLWRWFLFVGAVLGILWGWSGIIDLMK